MTAKPSYSIPSPPADDTLADNTLDRLFHECAELETLITSIRQTIDRLDPAVDSGLVTAEHLMNLAYRVENAEHGLIAIAHQISDTATAVIQRRNITAAVRWSDSTVARERTPKTTIN